MFNPLSPDGKAQLKARYHRLWSEIQNAMAEMQQAAMAGEDQEARKRYTAAEERMAEIRQEIDELRTITLKLLGGPERPLRGHDGD